MERQRPGKGTKRDEDKGQRVKMGMAEEPIVVTKVAAEAALLAQADGELYAALEAFGDRMIGEGQDHRTAIEAKGLSVLGWTVAVLALSLSADFAGSLLDSGVLLGAALVGTAAAIVAIGASIVCVKTEPWAIPSREDWFRTDLFADVMTLRAYHLMSLFEMDETNRKLLKRKGHALAVAQWGLIVAGVALLVILVVRIASGLTTPDSVGPPLG